MSYIVFDLDGTLLDSKSRHKIVLRDALNAISNEVNIDINDYVSYKANGYSTKQYLVDKHKFDITNAEKSEEFWKELIEKPQYLSFDVLYSDTIPVLDLLAGKYDIMLLTARKNEGLLVKQLKKLMIFDYFRIIKCVNPFKAFEEKTSFLQNYGNILFSAGDTEIDYNAAMDNKIRFYPLNRGFRSIGYWNKLNVFSYKDLDNITAFL